MRGSCGLRRVALVLLLRGTRSIDESRKIVDNINYRFLIDGVNYFLCVGGTQNMPDKAVNNESVRQVHEQIFRLMHGIKSVMTARLKASDIGLAVMEVKALKVISLTEQCSPLELAVFLERDKAQITRLLKSLVDLGLISKSPNPADKRSQVLVVTSNGQSVLKRLSKIEAEVFGGLFEGLTPRALKEFEQTCVQLHVNLEQLKA